MFRLSTSLRFGVFAASLLVAAPAFAAEDPEQAKILFDVGAKAYGRGNFPAAIQAFEQSNKLAPRPGLVFSLAQAYRKQYYIDKRPEGLARSLALYREYVALVGDGGRRAEASQYVIELEPIAERLGAKPEAAAPYVPKTRIMINSPTDDARVALDGEKPVPAPLFVEAKPGKHAITIVSPGHFDEARSFDLQEGAVVALDIPLRERPALVTVDTASGAQVSVDGRYVATTPQPSPLEIAPGPHVFTVAKNGHLAFSEEIDLGRGEAKRVAAPLPRSSQRIASYSLMGLGAAGLVGGGVFLGFAVAAENRAKAVAAEAAAGNADPARLEVYESAVQARADFSRLSGVAFGAGAAAGLVGILLYAFDQPAITGKPAPKKRPEKAPIAAPTDVAAAPVVGPGELGAVMSFRF
jgi:hypothetical protein